MLDRTWQLSGKTDSVAISGQVVNVSGAQVRISGQVVNISGQTSGAVVNISGQVVNISGQMSGMLVSISGQSILISGQPISVSGQPIIIQGTNSFVGGPFTQVLVDTAGKLQVAISGQTIGISGQVVNISGQTSGEVVNISGQVVNVSGQLSGHPVRISGQPVYIISGFLLKDATTLSNSTAGAGITLPAFHGSGNQILPVVIMGIDPTANAQAYRVAQVDTDGSLHVITTPGEFVGISGTVSLISGGFVNVSGQPIGISGQVVNISGQMSGTSVQITQSGETAAVDSINDALIVQDILHRKIHQGFLWQIQTYESCSGTATKIFCMNTSANTSTSRIHLSWEVAAEAGTRVQFSQNLGFIGASFSGKEIPRINMKLGVGGQKTSTTFYGSGSLGARVITPITDELIMSGKPSVGYGTLFNYPLKPTEFVTPVGQMYEWLVTPPTYSLVSFYASWYESGA